MAAKFLSTEEVSAETGATLRQLQWWDEQGIMRPQWKGRDRRYSKQQAHVAWLFVTFRKYGIPPRRALAYMEQARFWGIKPVYILQCLADLKLCGLRVR